jgi:hypothetical protein
MRCTDRIAVQIERLRVLLGRSPKSLLTETVHDLNSQRDAYGSCCACHTNGNPLGAREVNTSWTD